MSSTAERGAAEGAAAGAGAGVGVEEATRGKVQIPSETRIEFHLRAPVPGIVTEARTLVLYGSAHAAVDAACATLFFGLFASGHGNPVSSPRWPRFTTSWRSVSSPCWHSR